MAFINHYVKTQALRDAMIEKEVYSHHELQIRTDLSKSVITDLFNWPEKPKRLKTCLAVCKALGKNMNELFETR